MKKLGYQNKKRLEKMLIQTIIFNDLILQAFKKEIVKIKTHI